MRVQWLVFLAVYVVLVGNSYLIGQGGCLQGCHDLNGYIRGGCTSADIEYSCTGYPDDTHAPFGQVWGVDNPVGLSKPVRPAKTIASYDCQCFCLCFRGDSIAQQAGSLDVASCDPNTRVDITKYFCDPNARKGS
jgi:hypothetical protein